MYMNVELINCLLIFYFLYIPQNKCIWCMYPYMYVFVCVVCVYMHAFEMPPLHLFCSCKSIDYMHPQYYQNIIIHHFKSIPYFVAVTIKKECLMSRVRETAEASFWTWVQWILGRQMYYPGLNFLKAVNIIIVMFWWHF